MKKIHLLYIAFCLPLLCWGQTADDILQQHFDNNGGYKQWNQLSSVYIEGEVIMNVEEPVALKIEHRRPYFKRVSFIIDGKEKLSEGYDGKKGYTYNETTGEFIQIPNYTPDAFETDILNYKKKGFKAELLGKDTIDNEETYKIRLTKNTQIVDYWFRAKDAQLLQTQDDLETVSYGDFKKFKGLTFACEMVYTPKEGREYMIVFNKIEPNKAIDDKRFIFKNKK